MKRNRHTNQSLAINAVYSIIYRVMNVIFPLITASYVARVLEPEGVGKVAYAQNIVSYFVLFAVLGIPRYGTREIARNRGNQDEINKIFSELIVINTISTAVCALGYYTAICFFEPADVLLYLICGTEILFNFISIDWLYEGEEEYGYITLRSILIKAISLIVLLTVVKDEKDYPWYALISCLGIGCNSFFNLFHARKKVKITFRHLNVKRHMGPVMILALSVITASIYNKADITMLGWLCDEETVAYYSNAHKIVNMVITLVIAISGVFMPRMSYLYKADRDKFREIITVGLKVVLFLALPCCAGLIMVSENLVMLVFGDAFLSSVPALQIMATLVIVIGVGDLLCWQVIISSGNEKLLFKSRIFASVVNIVLNALLIPYLQHAGAAIASVISELVVNTILIKTSFKIARPQLTGIFVSKILLGVGVMVAAVICVQKTISNITMSLIFSVLIGVVVYMMIEKIVKNDVIDLVREMASF